MFGYQVPKPNEALLISGRKQRGTDALQFKIVTGHGVFVTPIFSRSSRLSLAMQEAEVVEDCFTQQGLTLAVHAVIAFKVGDDHESIASAARRFQGDQGQMPTLVGRIFSGHRRLSCVDVQITSMSTEKLDEALTDDRDTRDGLAVECKPRTNLSSPHVRSKRSLDASRANLLDPFTSGDGPTPAELYSHSRMTGAQVRDLGTRCGGACRLLAHLGDRLNCGNGSLRPAPRRLSAPAGRASHAP